MSRHHTHLNARRWGVVRRAVFERDGYRCVECGKAGRLECDHVTPLQRDPGQDPFDLNSLQTLCRACHIAKTARENRRPFTPAEAAWQTGRFVRIVRRAVGQRRHSVATTGITKHTPAAIRAHTERSVSTPP